MSKIVVFGGSGFLGSYIVDELLERGFEVINADINKPKYNIKNQIYKQVDIMDLDSIQNVITDDVEYVYNFAGLADINVCINNPIKTIKLNILGNTNILEVCKRMQIKRFIYASSVYSFSNKGTFYGITKQSSEKIIEEYYSIFGLNYTILRYGSLYGERADEHNGIYKLLKQAIQNKKIIYPGSSEESREFIHCKDAAKLSVDILDSKYKNTHLLLTGLEKYKFKDLLYMIKELFNDSIEIECKDGEYRGHYKVTPYTFHPTIGKKIVANPYVDLGQGLLECISIMHQNLVNNTNNDDWIINE